MSAKTVGRHPGGDAGSKACLLFSVLLPTALVAIGCFLFLRAPEMMYTMGNASSPGFLSLVITTLCLAAGSAVISSLLSPVRSASSSRGLSIANWILFYMLLVFGVLLVFSETIFDLPLEKEFLAAHKPGSFEGKTILITGANSGVGLEAAAWALHWGRAKTVYLATRNTQKCEAAKREILARKGWFVDGDGAFADEHVDNTHEYSHSLRCFTFDLLPFGTARDRARIEDAVRNEFSPPSSEGAHAATSATSSNKVDIIVSNAGYIPKRGSDADAMYVSHKILERALKNISNPSMKVVTVSSMLSFVCLPASGITRSCGLCCPLTAFAAELTPTAGMKETIQASGSYNRVKFWQVLDGGDIVVPLGWVKTSINPDVMDTFFGRLMRTARIGALPIVEAMLLVSDQAEPQGLASGLEVERGSHTMASSASSDDVVLQLCVNQQFSPSAGVSQPCFSEPFARLLQRLSAEGYLAEQKMLLEAMLQWYIG